MPKSLSMFCPLFTLLWLGLLLPELAHATTWSSSTCVTLYDTTSLASVPSSTTTSASTITSTLRLRGSATTTTMIPKMIVRTIIKDRTITTTRTVSQGTETFTRTLHVEEMTTSKTTSTRLKTTTETETKTTTSTVTPAQVVTVPVSIGFVPIQSVPGNPAGRRRGVAALPGEDGNGDGNGVEGAMETYPRSVNCGVSLVVTSTTTVTAVASKTITKTAVAPTSWITKTSIYREESVEYQPRTTITVTTRTTETFGTTRRILEMSTTTTTRTETATVMEAAPSIVFAGCGVDNFITSRNGTKVQGSVYETLGIRALTSLTSSALDCCQQCQVESTCHDFFWNGRYCVLHVALLCNAALSLVQYEASSGRANNGVWTVGNGNCGRLLWNGLP